MHEVNIIRNVNDVAFLRIRVEGGWIYITKNSNSMTSCFVPDNTAELAKEYKRGYDKGYENDRQEEYKIKQKVIAEHFTKRS